jgi:hypothetical protein
MAILQELLLVSTYLLAEVEQEVIQESKVLVA